VKTLLVVLTALMRPGVVASPAAPGGGRAWPVLAAGTRTARNVLFTPAALLLVALRSVTARPALLAALAVLLTCVPLGSRDVAASVHVTPGDICAAALVVVVGVRVVTGDRRLPRSGLWWAMAATIAAFAVATFTSHDTATSLSGFIRYTELFVVVPLAVVLALRDRRDALLVCAAAIAAAVIEGAVGTVQYLTGAGASYAGSQVRAIGTFSALDVQSMATVVGYGLVVAVGLAVALRGLAGRRLAVIAALLVIPLLLSLSRGGVIATVAAVLVMALVARPRLVPPLVVYGSGAALLIAGALGARAAGVGARLGSIGSSASTPDQSVTDRYVLWKTAAAIWRDHPITGVGLKEFPAYRDSYAPVNLSSGSDVAGPGLSFQREPLLSPHNMYLLVLSEQGIVGALALGGLLFGLAALTIQRVRQGRGPTGWPDGRASDGRAVSVAAVGVTVWTLVNFMYGDIGGQTTVLTSVLLGLALWWAVQGPAGAARAAGRPA
jgi:O-antigen ligase